MKAPIQISSEANGEKRSLVPLGIHDSKHSTNFFQVAIKVLRGSRLNETTSRVSKMEHFELD
jgi:hypothetical protein